MTYSAYSGAERRAAPRQRITMDGTLRESGGRRIPITLHDISVVGFSCEYAHSLRIGQKLWAKFANLDVLDVQVVRRDGYRYGLMFETPLNPAVFDYIITHYGRVSA